MPSSQTWSTALLQRDVCTPADVCMIAMTSGSTGKPKVIAVTHRATVVNYLSRYHQYPYTDDDVEAANIFFVWENLRGPMRGTVQASEGVRCGAG